MQEAKHDTLNLPKAGAKGDDHESQEYIENNAAAPQSSRDTWCLHANTCNRHILDTRQHYRVETGHRVAKVHRDIPYDKASSPGLDATAVNLN